MVKIVYSNYKITNTVNGMLHIAPSYAGREVRASMNTPQWFTPAQAAEKLTEMAGRTVTVNRLNQMRREGRIQGTVHSHNFTLYSLEDLQNADISLHKVGRKFASYKGWRSADGTHHITFDGRPLQNVGYHSQEYSWGYSGSGTSDTALTILAHYFHERPARTSKRLLRGECKSYNLHQDFKQQFVCGWDDTWEITSEEIAAWLATVEAEQVQV